MKQKAFNNLSWNPVLIILNVGVTILCMMCAVTQLTLKEPCDNGPPTKHCISFERLFHSRSLDRSMPEMSWYPSQWNTEWISALQDEWKMGWPAKLKEWSSAIQNPTGNQLIEMSFRGYNWLTSLLVTFMMQSPLCIKFPTILIWRGRGSHGKGNPSICKRTVNAILRVLNKLDKLGWQKSHEV